MGMSEMCPQGLDSQLIDLSLAANILLRSEPLEDDEEEEDEEKDDEEDDNDDIEDDIEDDNEGGGGDGACTNWINGDSNGGDAPELLLGISGERKIPPCTMNATEDGAKDKQKG